MKDAKGHGSDGRNGGVGAKPIPGHPYHTKTNAELRYIAKDASEAERATRGMPGSGSANGKYADQVNDASTVLGYRNRGGLSDAPSDVASRTAVVDNSPKSAPVPTHDSMSGTTDAAGIKNKVYEMVKGMHTSRPDTSRY
jgi:hypothetical protein